MMEKVIALNKAAEELENKNPKEALTLAEQAYEIAVKEKYDIELVKSLIRIGRCLWLMGSYQEAVKNLNIALELSKTLDHGIYEVEALKALGNVQSSLNIYDNAINFYAKALKIVKRDQLTHLEPSLLNNIGGTYLNLEEYDEGLNYVSQCLVKCQELGDRFGETVSTYNLGEVYFKKKDYVQSKEYALKSLQISQEDHDRIGYSYSLYLLGIIEKENNHYDKALTLLNDSLKIANETSDYNVQVEILINMSEIYINDQHIEEGINKLHEALTISEMIDGNTITPTIYSKLANAYEQLGNQVKTLEYYKMFHDATNDANEMRREEKLRSITFQLKLEQSQQETETYRELMRELEKRTQELSQSYSQIQVVSEIGQSITSTLNLEKSFNRIYENINKLMKSTVLGIGLFNKEEDCIEFKLYKENGIDMPAHKISLSSTTSWAIWAFKHKQEIMINDVEKEYVNYLQGRKASIGSMMLSVIFYPLIVEGTIIGVVTVQSEERNAYEQSALDTMRIFASYIAIAINNAQKSEQLAEEIKIKEKAQRELENLNKKLLVLSELDGLTNIPNRRCFDQEFEKEWKNSLDQQSPLSILIIDIDKFKEYNDNYGHLEGDQVIQQIAKVIEQVALNQKGMAARYGGDEFVILIKEKNADETLKVAMLVNEAIRNLGIRHEYSPIKDIITLSIGCSVIIPNQSIEKQSLLNKADEALYRSKDKGSNREELLIL